VKQEAKRLGKIAPDAPTAAPEIHVARAYPVAGQPFLVITDTDGHPREAKIRAALPISEGVLREVAGDRITQDNICLWSKRDGKVLARTQDCLGAIVLTDKRWPDAPEEDIAKAMLDGIRGFGISASAAANRFRARVALMRAVEPDLPDLTDEALLDTLEDWLLPYLVSVQTIAQWKAFDILPALRATLTWDQMQRLDKEVPGQFTTPLGRQTPIDYSSETPEISLRLQEMFGTTRHPTVAGRPLRVTFLSPGQKPIQTTMDVPGFWASSYADVRKDMRGSYPKHPWPEDPTQADPTLRAKPRK